MNIIVEPKIENYYWFKNITDNLLSFAFKRKYVFERYEDFKEIVNDGEKTPVIVIGTTYNWIAKQIKLILEKKRHPILVSNQAPHTFKGDYSLVSVDIQKSTDELINILKRHGYSKTALFGVNTASTADIGREKAFETHFGKENVFYIADGLEQSAEDFTNKVKNFDSVICVNSLAAVVLYKKLKEKSLKIPQIASDSYSEILSNYSDVLAINFDFKQFLSAAGKIYKIMEKDKSISGINVTIKHSIAIPDSLIDISEELQNSDICENENNRFFNDKDVKNISLIDELLSKCDETDKKIIDMLINNYKYEKIAEDSFLSLSTVKYKVGNMMELCGISSKSAFCEFLRKYK